MILIDSYPESNWSATGGSLNGIGYSHYGQTFTVPSNCTLIGVSFYLSKALAPVSDMNFGLWSTTGAADAEVPLNNLAYSDSVTADDVLTITPIIYYMPFVTPYAATPGVYAVTAFLDGGDATNYVFVGNDNSTPTHSGHRVGSLNGTSWTYSNSVDVIFYVWAQDNATGNMFLLF